MEESTCDEMVIDLLKILSCMECYFSHFSISLKYDFLIDAVRMIIRTREMSRNIFLDGLKYCTAQKSSVGKSCRYL